MTTKTTKKAIKKSNAKFEKMTSAQKRVQIAKDVIAHLNTRAIIATSGIYVEPAGRSDTLIRKPLLDKELSIQLPAKCNACALGGMFISALLRFDDFTVADADKAGFMYGGCVDEYVGPEVQAVYGFDRPDAYLKRFFSDAQMGLIEAAFERDDVHARSSPRSNQIDAVCFGERFNSPSKCMRAIMENIIANEGAFKP